MFSNSSTEVCTLVLISAEQQTMGLCDCTWSVCSKIPEIHCSVMNKKHPSRLQVCGVTHLHAKHTGINLRQNKTFDITPHLHIISRAGTITPYGLLAYKYI